MTDQYDLRKLQLQSVFVIQIMEFLQWLHSKNVIGRWAVYMYKQLFNFLLSLIIKEHLNDDNN